ncbi:hypothetical protein F5884DRAFT_237129 [Xylogone sp. PMI_703]|nr:hypothetical protein F5884DRAFT_237129 [Xylogone sp. PMI_703]
MTQKHSILASINSSQIDLSKPSKDGDNTRTTHVNEPIRAKRIVPPERLQAFDPMTYGLRRNSISSMNSTAGLSPSHLPYPPSMRSTTPDSMASKRWVDPRDIHFNRPSTPATKAWVSPLDVHFSRPTTPLASRPTTPTSALPSRRFSLGSNLPSTMDKSSGIMSPTEGAMTSIATSDAKLAGGHQNLGDAQEDISGLESEMFPLPPTVSSRTSIKLQASELEQYGAPSREMSHSRKDSSNSFNETPEPAVTHDRSEKSLDSDHSGFRDSTLSERQEASSVSADMQPTDPSPDISSQPFKDRGFSIAASSRYSTNEGTFDAKRESGSRSRSHSLSLDSQSRQQFHTHRRSSSVRGANAGLDSLDDEGRSVSDRSQPHGGSLSTPQEDQILERPRQFYKDLKDATYGSHSGMEARASHFSIASSVEEDTAITPIDSNHNPKLLPRSHLATPKNLEIGTAIPFGTGLHKRGTSEASENSIGDFYDAYYRLSTMGITNDQDPSVTGQQSKHQDRESTTEVEQSWGLDAEENPFEQYPPSQGEQSEHDTGTGEFWRPKPQKLYFQSPNPQRPYDARIPKQLQPQHIQQQQDFLYDRDLPLPHRKGTPAPPSFRSSNGSHDDSSGPQNQQRYSPPSQLDIGRSIVEMHSPLASPTFGSQGQSRYPSRVI